MPYNKERLLKLKEKYAQADRQLCTVKEPENMNREYVYEQLKEYLRIRLLLEETDMESDHLKTIIEINLEKQEKLLRSGVKLEDVLAPGCAGITGAAAKKIYLFLTIQTLLGIRLDEMQTPYIETIQELADAVIQLLKTEEYTDKC